MDFDTEVKIILYNLIAQNAKIPDSAQVAATSGIPENSILEAFQRLAAKRLLVLEPGDPSKIRMAPPFSGIQTTFRVEVNDRSYYANCVWDAFGVAAALHQDGIVYASDGFTNEPLIIEIKDGETNQPNYVAHFAIPAAQWWDDIIHT